MIQRARGRRSRKEQKRRRGISVSGHRNTRDIHSIRIFTFNAVHGESRLVSTAQACLQRKTNMRFPLGFGRPRADTGWSVSGSPSIARGPRKAFKTLYTCTNCFRAFLSFFFFNDILCFSCYAFFTLPLSGG